MKQLLQITVVALISFEILGQDLHSPVYNESCPLTMYYQYPIKNNWTVWICECQPTFLYYPDDDNCYDAYRQGPCHSEHYLVLPPGELEAKCVKNPCLIDGLVPFQDKCHFLWKSGSPCESNLILGVNATNFELKCSGKEYNGLLGSLTTSKSCPENTILRPANDNNKTHICECKPGFLYNPTNNSCHNAYRQGPCPAEYYFVIPSGEKVARCEKNPCLEDGLVPFQGGCYPLGIEGPPCTQNQGSLQVNKQTFELYCKSIFQEILSNRPSALKPAKAGIINAPPKACAPGSRRISTGLCKLILQ